MNGVTLSRYWHRLGQYWSGSVYYQHDEYGRPQGLGVRWEAPRDGEILIATTGHGGITVDTAKGYATALTVATEIATDSLTWPDGGE